MKHISYRKLNALHCEWYRANGKYPQERITSDSSGVDYVIGDWSWARRHPDKPELIDRELDKIAKNDA